jgi:hypothetical protein
MATMLPKVLEIERRQLADYARVDYAITANFRGLAGHHRELVSAEISELGCPRHRRRPRPFRV